MFHVECIKRAVFVLQCAALQVAKRSLEDLKDNGPTVPQTSTAIAQNRPGYCYVIGLFTDSM